MRLKVVNELGVKLIYTVDTDHHADRITSALQLRREAGSRIVYPIARGVPCADLELRDGEIFKLGGIEPQGAHTRATDDHFAYVLGDRVFTGDALLIDGCGRTDFQNGNAATLYRSVREKLFSLAPDTLVYPAHDYAAAGVIDRSGAGAQSAPRLRHHPLAVTADHEGAQAALSDIHRSRGAGQPRVRRVRAGPDRELERYCRQIEESPQGVIRQRGLRRMAARRQGRQRHRTD